MSPHAVVCRPRPELFGTRVVEVGLGDGDDEATVLGPGMRLRGGPGADRLTGGDGADELDGGAGADLLLGGAGADRFLAVEGETGNDRVDGGAGTDALLFSGRSGATADLATGRARTGGRRFAFAGIEGLVGGAGRDRLLGDGGPNRIYGFDGNDVVDGRGGDDRVTGGGGRDVVRGGSGDDRLELGEEADPYVGEDDAPGNRLECGSGTDHVGSVVALDTVTADCEGVASLGLLSDLRRAARAHFSLPLARCTAGRRCGTYLSVRIARGDRAGAVVIRRLLRTGRPLPAGRGRVTLGCRDRAVLERHRATRVIITVDDPRADRLRFVLVL